MSRSAAHDQRNDAMRAGFLKPMEFAAAAAPTAEIISATAQKLGLEHSVEDVPGAGPPAKIHWLGNRKADKVLLYFHGGGFAIPILEGHVKFLSQTMEQLNKQGKKMSVALLEYTLSPAARYPVQITQACEALRLLLSQGYEPSSILIGGDSAGGNLALAVLSVISHGFKGIQRLELNGKLAGALLVSPWVKFSAGSDSWRSNIGKDVISLETLPGLVDIYRNPEERNEYSEPSLAKPDWWNNLAAQRILNVYGGYEVFKDDIAHLSRALTQSGNSVQDSECAMQVHIDSVLDAQVDLEAGEMSRVIWQWLGHVV